MAAVKSSKKTGKKQALSRKSPMLIGRDLSIFKFNSKKKITTIAELKPAQLLQYIEEYIQDCLDKNIFPMTIEFINFLGISSRTYYKIKEDERFVDIIQRFDDFCEMLLSRDMIDRKNCTGLIFYMKNKFGWQDRIENKFDIKIEYPDKESRI